MDWLCQQGTTVWGDSVTSTLKLLNKLSFRSTTVPFIMHRCALSTRFNHWVTFKLGCFDRSHSDLSLPTIWMHSMCKCLNTVDELICRVTVNRMHHVGSSHLHLCNKEVKLPLECGSTFAVNQWAYILMVGEIIVGTHHPFWPERYLQSTEAGNALGQLLQIASSYLPCIEGFLCPSIVSRA